MAATAAASSAAGNSKPVPGAREQRNWLIHMLYVRNEYSACLKVIDTQLRETDQQSEYALHVKGLILRHQGKVAESMALFEAATVLNPYSPSNLKQVGRSLFLLGKMVQALEYYDEAEDLESEDWDLWHQKGLCFSLLGDHDEAIECFHRANDIQPHDESYLQLARLYGKEDDLEAAQDTLQEALDLSPQNPDLLTAMGLLNLRMGDAATAFENLGNAMTIDPRNPRAILAAGSVMQDNADNDVALIKYRISAAMHSDSPQLWNNIGMCFFGKKKYVACISCLKRAWYLAPFEWLIAFNLGLAHLASEQYASAFHYLSASVNINSNNSRAYMCLAVALEHLDDEENAEKAYEKAVQAADPDEYLALLNYASFLARRGDNQRAKELLLRFEEVAGRCEEAIRANGEPHIFALRRKLGSVVGLPTPDSAGDV